ncbi:Serine/threonine-protein kinase 3 [Hondaea fermentalgiana]|uniref:non-specific serine/threonine protein kinase n=1 Tax=Hondaea fermentalgiana TaxID=2315210 RepID=A0A2R5GE73_9STRA|nr:Serine/threonine-protein kinase 3 [Hondaea fermentalgiana]|eukprot:GBG29216.1 Serine/threonine-protein kinase 3 [Hondaea fermentalgiana]
MTMRGLEKGDPEELFELEESLGEGSYGEVFKASYKDGSDGFVAVKIIPIEDDLADLEKEIDILKSTKDTFIVEFVGAYKDAQQDRIWIVMELCMAGSVNDLIHICDVSLTENEIRVISASVLLGLHYLHSQRMIHRDIKAGNILLTESGHAKLADFGVSARLEADQSKRRTVIGTPFWMSPEVISESSYDGKADIWSLGITIIEMADQEPPYSNIHPMRAIFMIPSRPPPNFLHPDEFSDELQDFLKQCLQKDPSKRPTAQELMEHPFVRDTVDELDSGENRGYSPIIEKLVSDHLEEINEARLVESQNRSQGIATSISGTRGKTARYVDSMQRRTSKARSGRDTMEMNEDSGTLVANGSGYGTSIFTPPTSTVQPREASFMRYFMSHKTKKKAHKQQLDEDDDDWTIPDNAQEMIELTNRLQNLDHQFQRDVAELKKAYDERRAALLKMVDDPE